MRGAWVWQFGLVRGGEVGQGGKRDSARLRIFAGESNWKVGLQDQKMGQAKVPKHSYSTALFIYLT